MPGEFSKQFHRQTDFHFPPGATSNFQYLPKEWAEIGHKEYPRTPKVELSETVLALGDMKKAFDDRRSERKYDLGKTLTKDELSTLLHYSASARSGNETEIRRFYPSSGACYPLETYLVIQRVQEITPGIYHYNVKDHLLEKLSPGISEIESIKEGLLYPWAKEAAVIYIITAVWNRNFLKYKDRGYRMVLMEAGHMAQNLSLVSSALNLNCCNSTGFDNEKIDEILDITNEDEDSLYMALIGK